MLNHENIYKDFNHEVYKLDLQGWNSHSPMFKEMIERTRPRIIIEVGTWKGASAIHMAKLTKDLGLDTRIICVDTWLGSYEFWADCGERYQLLKVKNGHPQLYEQFLANVVKSGMQDVIIPFPNTSAIAARLFRYHYKIQADLIYIDASHDYYDVIEDIKNYKPLLTKGGLMFGDDFSQAWPDVQRAVLETAGPDLEVKHSFWAISHSSSS